MTEILARIDAAARAAGFKDDKALCAAAGLSDAALRMARKAGSTPTLPTLRKIAGALGRTVAELTGEAAPAPAGGAPVPGLRMMAWADLRRSPNNPRKTFDPEGLQELAESIARDGILENLVARPIFAGPLFPDYRGIGAEAEIIAGERRHRAVEILIEAGRWSADSLTIPVLLKDLRDDAEALILSIVENAQRADVAPMEEAEAFAKLAALGWSTAGIAEAIGKTQRLVQLRLALVTKLDPKVQDALRKGKITLAQARALTGPPQAKQRELLKMIEGGSWQVRTAEDLQRYISAGLPRVDWALFDLGLYTGEIIEPEGREAERVFADKEQFHRLQAEALKARKAELGRQGWAFVQSIEGRPEWNRHQFKPAPAGTPRKKMGVVIYFQSSGQAWIEENQVAVQEEAAATLKTAAGRREAEAERERAAEHRARAQAFEASLRGAVAARPALALALLAAEDFASDEPGAEPLDNGTVLESFVVPAAIQRLAKLPPAARFAELTAMPLDALAAIVAEQVSMRIGSGLRWNSRVNAYIADAAAVAGVPLPEGVAAEAHCTPDEEETDEEEAGGEDQEAA